MPDPTTSYSRGAIWIHWLTAAGVALAVALGWRLANAGGSERDMVQAWHLSAGVAVLLMTLARLAVRTANPRPPPIGARWEQRAAAVVHLVFYVALIVIPLAGWLAVSASGGTGQIFGFVPLPMFTALSGSNGVVAFAEAAHRYLAYGLCALIFVHLIAALRHQQHGSGALPRILPMRRRPWGWSFSILAALLLLTFSFGSGVLDRWLPESLTLAGSAPASRFAGIDPRRSPVFSIAQPILEEKCASCHGAGSQKGGLRLDTLSMVMRGGDSGKVVVAGKAEESELIQRIFLPPSHKHAMPPVGKPTLTPAESQLLMWWIATSVDESETIVAANPPPLVQTILQNLGVKSESAVFRRSVAIPDPKTLASLRETFEIHFLYRGDAFLQAQPRFDLRRDEALRLDSLVPVADQLARLDLSGASIDDVQLRTLGRLQGLQRLNLSRTPTDDSGVRALQDLPYLEVLNLYGTRVTDASVGTLERMPSLMTVYLTGTAVTAQAVDGLRKAKPGLSVIWVPEDAD